MRFPLRYKILAVVGVLLIAAVSLYTWLASSIFKNEKIALLFDVNHSVAVNLAAQIRAQIQESENHLRLFGLSKLMSSRSRFQLPSDYLSKHSIEAVKIFRHSTRGIVPVSVYGTSEWNGVQETLQSKEDKHQVQFWRSSDLNKNKTLFLSTTITIERSQKQKVQYIVAAELGSDYLSSLLDSTSLYDTYVFDTEGDLLANTDSTESKNEVSISSHPIVQQSRTSNGSGVNTYSYEGGTWYGAFAPVQLSGLFVLSQAPATEVTTAITVLIKRSLQFGLIVITATFLASILFSKRITRNLQNLASRMTRVGNLELDSKIHVSSHDEVEDLANAFNWMMGALRESLNKIEKYNKELESMVALRTKQLKEKNVALEEIQQELIHTTQLAAIGEVAGQTAHEVLNPLTSVITRLDQMREHTTSTEVTLVPKQIEQILDAWEKDYKQGGMDQVLREFSKPSSVVEGANLFEEDLHNLRQLTQSWVEDQHSAGNNIQFVREQAERIQNIVDGMRGLVRSSTVRGINSCHTLLKEAILTIGDLVEQEGIELEEVFEATQDETLLNREEFIQIISNLLRNAHQSVMSKREGHPEWKAKITVRTSNQNNTILIDVIDNGIGIQPHDQKRLFEQGFTTKPPSQGTGLGLAIARRYTRSFGGDVWLESSDPQKAMTCFRVSLPLAESSKDVLLAG